MSETAPPAAVPGQPAGIPAVDAARRRLADLDGASVETHVQVYDDVHQRLHEALVELDET